MDENRRSGVDRREKKITVVSDRRSVTERSSLVNQASSYVSVFEKVPIFKGLTHYHLKRILRICSKQIFARNDVLCTKGEESLHMFILLTGLLSVRFPSGEQLSYISPGETVGEMGVLTGERRSATVVAAEDSIVISIHKAELFTLFRKDSSFVYSILMNVIRDMARKLRKNNEVIEELKGSCPPEVYNHIVSKMKIVSE